MAGRRPGQASEILPAAGPGQGGGPSDRMLRPTEGPDPQQKFGHWQSSSAVSRSWLDQDPSPCRVGLFFSVPIAEKRAPTDAAQLLVFEAMVFQCACAPHDE